MLRFVVGGALGDFCLIRMYVLQGGRRTGSNCRRSFGSSTSRITGRYQYERRSITNTYAIPQPLRRQRVPNHNDSISYAVNSLDSCKAVSTVSADVSDGKLQSSCKVPGISRMASLFDESARYSISSSNCNERLSGMAPASRSNSMICS